MAIRVELNIHHGSQIDRDYAEKQGWYCVVVEPQRASFIWPDVHKWCVEEFGKHNYTHWGAEFYFRRENDAVLFALKYT